MANIRRVTTVTSYIPFVDKKKALTQEGAAIIRDGLFTVYRTIPPEAEISLEKAEGGGFELVVKYEPAEEVAAS